MTSSAAPRAVTRAAGSAAAALPLLAPFVAPIPAHVACALLSAPPLVALAGCVAAGGGRVAAVAPAARLAHLRLPRPACEQRRHVPR